MGNRSSSSSSSSSSSTRGTSTARETVPRYSAVTAFGETAGVYGGVPLWYLSTAAWRYVPVWHDLVAPSALVDPGGAYVYIADRVGIVYRARLGEPGLEKVLDLRAYMTPLADLATDPRGLLNLVAHPRRPLLYALYTAPYTCSERYSHTVVLESFVLTSTGALVAHDSLVRWPYPWHDAPALAAGASALTFVRASADPYEHLLVLGTESTALPQSPPSPPPSDTLSSTLLAPIAIQQDSDDDDGILCDSLSAHQDAIGMLAHTGAQDPHSVWGKLWAIHVDRDPTHVSLYALGFRAPYRATYDARDRTLLVGERGAHLQSLRVLHSSASGPENHGYPAFHDASIRDERLARAMQLAYPHAMITPPLLAYDARFGTGIVAGVESTHGTYLFGDRTGAHSDNVYMLAHDGLYVAPREQTRAAHPILNAFARDRQGRVYVCAQDRAAAHGAIYRLEFLNP